MAGELPQGPGDADAILPTEATAGMGQVDLSTIDTISVGRVVTASAVQALL